MIFSNCTDVSLRKEYTGYWAETKFTYQFERLGKFKFITEGHFGNTITKGEYAKIDSIILLHPYTDWSTYHGVLKNRLIIENNGGCLRDFDFNVYCNDVEKLNERIELDYDLIETIKLELSKLSDVKKGIDSISFYNFYDSEYPHIVHNGIINIDNIIYHSFRIRKRNNERDDFLNPYIYLQNKNYLVNQLNGQVYRHVSAGDKIVEIGKINAANTAPPSTG